MRDAARCLAMLAIAFYLLLSASATWAASPGYSSTTSSLPVRHPYPTSSWALGVVVPEGAGLQDGRRLQWEGASNVTAAVTLPNITLPNGIVYAVMSVMTSDGAVLQVAAGVYPNRSVWLAYSWAIPDTTGQLGYRWILNSSAPEMAPGAQIAVSIFQASSQWNLKVADEDTGASVSRAFPSGPAPSLKAGDQEVFALESYSRSLTTFQSMGNLTLNSLKVDGQKVTGGFYSYGNWDPNHSPAFVVGSAGTTPPSFVTIDQISGGSFVWTFAGVWSGEVSTYGAVASLALVLLVLGVTVVALHLAAKFKRMSTLQNRG